MSPTRSVPRWISTVATAPRPRSSLASITTPSAGRSGLALQIEQLGLQQDRFLELVEIGLLERRDFDVEHLAAELFDHDLVLQQLLAHPLGLASALSILLMATMIGTCAALAWRIASTVCCMMPSSAATTSTTMSVTLAPRARIAVKAAWPGVSMKVICRPLLRST